MILLYTKKEVANEISTIDDFLTVLFNPEYEATTNNLKIKYSEYSNYYNVTNILEGKSDEFLKSLSFFVVMNQPELTNLGRVCNNLMFVFPSKVHSMLAWICAACKHLAMEPHVPKLITKLVYCYGDSDNNVLITAQKFNNKFYVLDYTFYNKYGLFVHQETS